MIFLYITLIILHFNSFCLAYSNIDYEEKEQRSIYDIKDLIQSNVARIRNFQHFKNYDVAGALSNFEIDSIIRELEEELDNNSGKCLRDIIYTLRNFKQQWALQMIDSFGKPDSGILQGSVKWPGDYDECLNVYAPPSANSSDGDFHGKYCTLSNGNITTNMPGQMAIGLCLPDTCKPDVSEIAAFEKVFRSATNISITLTCKPDERTLSGPAIAVIVIISIFLGLCVVASSVSAVLHFLPKHEVDGCSELIIEEASFDEKGSVEVIVPPSNKFANYFLDVLGCFDMFRNGAKILNTSGSGEMLCLHGIRFLSMTWVILGHTYGFCLTYTRNLIGAINRVDNFAFEIVLQGFFSVDSFFVLSGFLLCYLTMQHLSKNKKISWLYFYIHRYIRLTPIYMIVLGFSASLFYYMGSGPFWPTFTSDVHCKESWWMNLLYINNFRNMTDQCMGWSWYLANDMQFFVISPIFLIALWKWTYIGHTLLAVTLCASCLTNFILTYKYSLIPGVPGMSGTNPANSQQVMINFMNYFNVLYTKPYARIGPYLIGMFTGYVVFRQAQKPIKLPRAGLLAGWIFFGGVTMSVVYGLYHQHLSVLASSFYNALNRSLFGAGLCWVIYVCLTKQGGPVNDILSCKLFIPLSRLTYTAYLIHPLVLTGYASSLEIPFQFSHPTLVLLFFGVLVATYGLSLVVCLVLESPVIALEKLIRTGGSTYSKRIN